MYLCILCSFIQDIYIAPLQVHYYSEALPTQHGYCVGVSRRSAQATASEGLAHGPYVVTRAGFEPTILRTKGDESTKEPPHLYVCRPMSVHTYLYLLCMN